MNIDRRRLNLNSELDASQNLELTRPRRDNAQLCTFSCTLLKGNEGARNGT